MTVLELKEELEEIILDGKAGYDVKIMEYVLNKFTYDDVRVIMTDPDDLSIKLFTK